MIIDSTSHKIRVNTSSVEELHVIASYSDLTATDVVPSEASFIITTATNTDIVASPSASTQRKILYLSFVNKGYGSNIIDIHKYNGTSSYTIYKTSLNAGEMLIYSEKDNWKKYSSTGEIISSGVSGDKGEGAGLKIRFSDTTTDSDPGSGKFRFNNASIGSVTRIFINTNDLSGTDITAWIDLLDDSTSSVKGHLYLVNLNDGSFICAQVTALTSATGYYKLTVSIISGSIPSNDSIFGVFLYNL